jgi:hypothetical protein
MMITAQQQTWQSVFSQQMTQQVERMGHAKIQALATYTDMVCMLLQSLVIHKMSAKQQEQHNTRGTATGCKHKS